MTNSLKMLCKALNQLSWISMLSNFKLKILHNAFSWCNPCRQLTPLLTEKYNSSNGEWVFAKVNVDNFGELAEAFNVRKNKEKSLMKIGSIYPNCCFDSQWRNC